MMNLRFVPLPRDVVKVVIFRKYKLENFRNELEFFGEFACVKHGRARPSARGILSLNT